MAGPVIAALGPYAFQAHGFGLTDVGRSLKTPWGAQNVAGGMNPLQFTGGDSDTLTIKGVLFPGEFGGLWALSGLRASAEKGTPLMFVNLAGQIMGMHVVEGVDEDRTFLDRNGLPLRNAYSLSLKRYAGPTNFNPVSALIGLFT